MRKSKAQREFERLSRSSRKTCSNCGYYRNGYCNDLDTYKSPDDYCSDENYYA